MNFDRDELRTLFAALNDGTISPADHARLEEILAQSQEARALWFLHCDIETGLADWAAIRNAETGGKMLSFTPPPPAAKSPRRWLAPFAAAAAIVLGAMWWMQVHRSHTAKETAAAETKTSGIAVLSRAVGAEWSDGNIRASGTVLEPGTLRLKSGAVLVEFFSGARLVVEGPAELQLVSAGEAFLRSGKVNAHVPPQARGFTVSSRSLKVVDFGTDFGIAVGGGDTPEVHVFTGEVEIATPALAPRSLHGGEAVRLAQGALQAIPAARKDFLAEDELARRDSEFARQRLAAWRESHRTVSADPATLIHYTFDEPDPSERLVTNQATDAARETHGNIVGSVRTVGRWPGKGALQFRSEGDRMRFTAPRAAEPVHAVTLVAWVRVDSLSRGQNVLLSADSERVGSLHWHLTGDGRLRLEIARDLGRIHSDWEAVNSMPFVTPDRFGQWLMLATTFDGKTIRHYANGTPIGTGESFTPPALLIGTAELGNWNGGTKRNLAAAVDEFAVVSRALSAGEINALYGSGRP